MKTKMIVAVAALMAMTGCANHQPVQASNDYPATGKVYKLQNYNGPEAMDNMEVVQASKQCILYKMRPNVSYLSVRTDQGKVMVPVSVICEPF